MRRIDKFATALTVAFVISMLIPDDWYIALHIGDVPLAFLVFAVLWLPLLGLLLLRRNVMTVGLAGGFAVFVVTAFYGFLRGNIGAYSIKFYVADVFCLGGLLAGHTIARSRRREGMARLVSTVVMTASVAIIATYIGLFTGVLKRTIAIEGRIVTLSIFSGIGILLILLPWATASTNFRRSKDSWRVWLLFGTALGTALLSATRSSFIEVVVAACLYVILRRKRMGFGFIFRLLCGAMAGAILFLVGLTQFATFTFDRLGRTQITEETRYGEVSLLWDQLQGDLWTGQGLGSRFVSNIVVGDSPLASAPHIGIMTFLMKGGIAMFLVYAVLPLCLAGSRIFSAQYPASQRSAAASVLMFLTLASLSGGWSPLYLFAYGMALASMTANETEVGVAKPKPIQTYSHAVAAAV